MNWRVPRIWDEADVWILGGGPSVTKEFNIPDEVVQSVVSGAAPISVYSQFMFPIHNEHVIGINVAYQIGDWIDMVFFGDSGFFLKHQEGLAKFKGMKVSCHPTAAKIDWVKYLARDSKHSKGISESPSMVSWNGNSGAAAISLAVNAGAKRVILLGFDMTLGTDSRQWWHNAYNKKAGSDTKDKRNRPRHLPFDRHLRGFSEIAKDAKKRGVEICNCSQTSVIKEFPKYTLKQLLYDNT